MKKKETVFVALSGGVDSAVAARLLMKDYERVIGVSHRHWPESRCCSTECIDRCALQCRDMGIPYYAVDCMVEFAQAIVDDFVHTYEQGNTPNPCVMCNQTIRFDLMLNKLFAQHPELKTPDYKMATGHYARVEEKNGQFYLRRGVDEHKDQSYMLHRLSSEQLSRCIFPLGSYYKPEVRLMAEEWGLRSAKQQDSQDVCFVTTNYQDFLKQYTGHGEKAGDFVDRDGNVLGRHEGAPYYTRGQRKGLGLSGGPWYVITANPKTGQVILGDKDDLLVQTFAIKQTRWIVPPLKDGKTLSVQLRYHAQVWDAKVWPESEDTYIVELDKASPDVCPGQSAVFYDGDYVVGGGKICLR